MARSMVLHTFVRWALIVFVCFAYFGSVLPSVAMTSTLSVGGACIEVVTDPSSPSLALEELVWVKTAAKSVRIYYGVFPISPISIHITPFRGRGIRNGMAFGTEKGGRITIRVGNETSRAELASDWMLVHEMVHLAFPSVAEEHHWIEEGIASYVGPIARQEHKRFGACSPRDSSGRRQYSKQLGSRGGFAGRRSRHRHERP